jgi:PAS domain S-box-containing protein
MATEPKANVLLVDDEPTNLLALEAALEGRGLNLVKAVSGEEALRHLLKEEFAVILLDVRMEGLSGFDTARLIRGRDRTRHTPILFVTAYETSELSVAEAYRLGAVDYLVKPLLPEVLRAKVAGFVELHRRSEQIRDQAEELHRLEQRELEHRLTEAGLRRFQAVIENSFEAVSMLDADGTVRYASPSTARNLGYIPEEVVGRNALDLTHPDDRPITAALFARLLQRPGGSETAAFRYRHKNGSWRWVEATWTNLLGEPSVRAVVSNYRDVTEQRELQNALHKEAERLAEAARHKDEFLAMLAHELRNPLAPLLNGVEVLELAGADPATLAETRAMLRRQARHLARLVNDLLDTSRLSQGKVRLERKPLDLAALVRTAVADRRHAAGQAGLEVVAAVPDGPVAAEADEARLTQVLTNLLDNAVKFTEAGGRVEVGLAADVAAGQAVLRVADTGVGIEPGLLTTLFEPFRQADRSLDRSKGGLGLGLALVKGLVELHGGTVEARSEGPGRGSEFVVRLPLAEVPVVPAEEAAAPAGPPLRVLVIEDLRDAADSLRILLEAKGYQVRVANSGPEGLKAARAAPFDVVLCDVGLPGLTGLEVARALRAGPHTAAARLIAVTGYGTEEDRRLALESGFDEHLTKPVALEALLRVLARQPSNEGEALAGQG